MACNWGDSRLSDRFWGYTHPEPNSGCWLWTGPCSGSRPQMSVNSKTASARRLAYEALVGAVPSKHDVVSRCITGCVTPEHAFLRPEVPPEQRRERNRKLGLDWIRRNPAKVKDSSLRGRYGIVQADIDRMRIEQQNRCRLCRCEFKPGKRHKDGARVDHCHQTGLVRSLLCQRCNIGLGQFMDDPGLLQLAIEYLATHKAKQ